MKQEIVKNEYYQLIVDIEKNRLYYNLFGFWRSLDVVPDNYKDMKTAMSKLKPGFDVVGDLRFAKPPPEPVAELHIKTQKLAMDMGLARTAEIYSEDAVKFMAERYSRESKMDTQVFSNILDAENWLDSFK
ncbi:MAG: hypothetical protein JW885_00705 [Deltaproteobacteria bacterium]|nr:hypothetical protein [Candidatus Zymogenaceae bacterium]